MRNRGFKRLFFLGLLITGMAVACGGSGNGSDAIGNGGNVQNGQDTTNPNPTGGTWTDPTTGYEWQVTPSDNNGNWFTWQEAVDYCKNLTLAGHSDWRLPTISELRSLIRGCPKTETGGECGVTDDCLDLDHCYSKVCAGCDYQKGPGQKGAYGPSELKWPDYSWYWSASVSNKSNTTVWRVDFNYGDVFVAGYANVPSDITGDVVRCVHRVP